MSRMKRPMSPTMKYKAWTTYQNNIKNNRNLCDACEGTGLNTETYAECKDCMGTGIDVNAESSARSKELRNDIVHKR